MANPDANSWLDTETKACLQRVPPTKLAPATTEAFSIVVLHCNPDAGRARHVHAFERVLRTSRMDAEFQATRAAPFLLQHELTLPDARLAQFELICCDIVSVFIADTVMSRAEPRYLSELWNALIQSEEFATVPVVVNSLPENEAGRAFGRQFLGTDIPAFPLTFVTTRKKARIMAHWAKKIDADVGAMP